MKTLDFAQPVVPHRFLVSAVGGGRWMIGRWMLGLWLLCLYGGYGTRPVGAQPLPDRRALTGRVTRADGTPIGGANIVVRRQDENAIAQFWGGYAVSDARGMFALPEVEEGAYYIDVEADGYAPEHNRDITLDKASPPLQIKLPQLVPLVLRILRPDGTPLANTQVMLRISTDNVMGTRLPRPVTDAAGLISFSVKNSENPNCPLCQLMPSHYAINVIAPGVGYVAIKDLNVEEQPKSKPVDVRLLAGGKIHVTAREDNTAGRPIGGATLSIVPTIQDDAVARQNGTLKTPSDLARIYTMQRDPSGAALVTRDGDGTIEITDLPPGAYKIWLYIPSASAALGLNLDLGQDAPDPQSIEIKRDETTNLTFLFKPMNPVSTLEIAAHDSQDQNLANADFIVQLRPVNPAGSEDVSGPLPPLPPGLPASYVIPNGSIRRAHSDGNGHFTLYPVKPGKYRLTLILNGDLAPNNPSLGVTVQDVTIPEQGGTIEVTTKLPAKNSARFRAPKIATF